MTNAKAESKCERVAIAGVRPCRLATGSQWREDPAPQRLTPCAPAAKPCSQTQPAIVPPTPGARTTILSGFPFMNMNDEHPIAERHGPTTLARSRPHATVQLESVVRMAM